MDKRSREFRVKNVDTLSRKSFFHTRKKYTRLQRYSLHDKPDPWLE